MDIPTTQARYQLRLFDTNGVLQAIFDDWRTLELQRRIDTYDTIQLGIDGSDSRISMFGLDCIIEVWRKLADTPAQYITTIAPLGYARTVLNDIPSAYYRLDEPVGQTQASDSSGNGNTGVYTNGVTLGQPGALAAELDGTSNTAALFNGTTAYVQTTPFNFAPSNPDVFTIEMWIKAAATITTRQNLTGTNNSASIPWIEVGPGFSGGSNRIVIASPGLFRANTVQNAIPDDLAWHHVVAQRNGAGDTFAFFVDGVSVAYVLNVATSFAGGSSILLIGARTASLQLFSGVIDEVAVYPTALSAARILAHYNAGLNQHRSDTGSTTVYVPGVSYPWYREGVCMHRTATREITQTSTRIYTSYGRGLIDLLRRREIMYFANTTFTLKGGPSETVMKQFVEENAGPSASNAARLADGTTQGFTVEASAGRGLTWAGQRSWQNLLDVLQEISTFGGVDFDVVRIDTNGPVTLEFRCYYPQLGTDRTATVLFASSFGNMLNPFYTVSRTDEITRVAALGPGEDTARRVIVRDGSTINDSPWNKVEKSQDARQDDTLTSLQAAGDAVIATSGPQKTFTFEVLQTSSLQYGRDYFLGDKVTAAFDTVSETKKITGVTMNVSQGRETVQLTFSDVPQTT